jgi:hypothetical protein
MLLFLSKKYMLGCSPAPPAFFFLSTCRFWTVAPPGGALHDSLGPTPERRTWSIQPTPEWKVSRAQRVLDHLYLATRRLCFAASLLLSKHKFTISCTWNLFCMPTSTGLQCLQASPVQHLGLAGWGQVELSTSEEYFNKEEDAAAKIWGVVASMSERIVSATNTASCR